MDDDDENEMGVNSTKIVIVCVAIKLYLIFCLPRYLIDSDTARRVDTAPLFLIVTTDLLTINCGSASGRDLGMPS